MIAATAVLAAWLMVEIARLMLGEVRFGRPLQGAHSAMASGESTATFLVEENSAAKRRSEASQRPRRDRDELIYDGANAEQMVRDRLYGGIRRHRR